MKCLSIFFNLILLFSAAFPVCAAQSRLSKSTLSGLIDQPVIAAILRDKMGFLWIGTQEGLYKFDGANLIVFNSDGHNKNWIPSSDIRGIAEDGDGTLLVATYGGGLLRWDTDSNAFVSSLGFNLVDESQLTSLHVSKQGNIWISSKENVLLYDIDFRADANWLAAADVTKTLGTPHVLLETEPGELIVGSSTGLSKVSIPKMTIKKFDLSSLGVLGNFGVTALVSDNAGNLIIGTDSGNLAVLNLNSGKIVAHANLGGKSPKLISDFSFHDDKLLIGTDKGLYLSEKNLSNMKDISLQGAGLSSSDIVSLYQDGDHVWVGTYNGLDILSSAPFELFNYKNSGINNDVLSFEQDSNDRIWVGTYGGLYLYDEVRKTHRKYEIQFDSASLVDQRVTALAVSKGQQLWVGFYRGGLQSINIESGVPHFPDIQNASEMTVMDMFEDREKSLWIATQTHGLIRVTPEKTYNYYKNGYLAEKGISIIFGGADTLIFVSTTNRVYEYDYSEDRFSILEFNFGFGLDKTVIFSVNQSNSGDIWFGTKDHGLFRWKNRNRKSSIFKLSHVGKGTEIEYSTVYGISSDESGNLWCSTQNGIFKLNTTGEPIKKFTMVDGLQGSDFSFGASFTSKAGLIYFGGMNGYNRFDPSKIEIDSSASPMRMTGISLRKQDDSRTLKGLADLKSLQLTHEDHFVTFQFSVLDFIDAEKNQFRYKLENFDTDWVENGTRNTATYTNLPAGDYTLRVQGANSAGIWNRDGIKFDIQVLPAPWYSWWAYLIYCVTLLLLGWGLHRIYRSYAIDRKSVQLAQEMFEAENKADDDMQEQLELQDDMVQSAYQHNITTLSLISTCITARSVNLPDSIRRRLTESSVKRVSALSSLEDCLSYQAGSSIANLQKYTDGIFLSLIEEAAVNPETIVAINEVTVMSLSAELASPISIILYELLENCVQHAFEKDSPANYIHVKLVSEGTSKPFSRYLHLSVHDSGIGVSDDIEALAGEGSGIAIVQSIVSELGGSLHFSSEKGTLVSIKIPDNA